MMTMNNASGGTCVGGARERQIEVQRLLLSRFMNVVGLVIVFLLSFIVIVIVVVILVEVQLLLLSRFCGSRLVSLLSLLL